MKHSQQREPEHIYSTRGRKRRVNIGLAMTIIHLLMLITGIFAKDNITKPIRKKGFGDRDASQGFYNLPLLPTVRVRYDRLNDYCRDTKTCLDFADSFIIYEPLRSPIIVIAEKYIK